jgi:hypothetical protein
MSKKELEKAINSYAKTLTKGDTFPTGWVVVASLAPAEESGNADSYLTVTSDGLPLHTQIGLMQLAQNDTRNAMMVSLLSGMVEQALGEPDDDEDE